MTKTRVTSERKFKAYTSQLISGIKNRSVLYQRGIILREFLFAYTIKHFVNKCTVGTLSVGIIFVL